MSDLRPPLSAPLDAFGLGATVTAPGGSAVTTTVIWMPPVTAETPAAGQSRAEPVRVVAVPLVGLTGIPRGTVILFDAVPPGESTASWRADEMGRIEFDHYRVVVVPA